MTRTEKETAPKFGTSGLRGLVTQLTAECVTRYVQAFLAVCDTGGAVHIGEDLRPSSAQIAGFVADAARAAGHDVIVHGPVPTPALALAAGAAGQGAIMVTGSHIPADRNGLKFYRPNAEISKADEAAITRTVKEGAPQVPAQITGGCISAAGQATQSYVARYIDAFGPDALHGLTIGVYQHSSVARDVLVSCLRGLGATPVALARSDTFVPVDTEAVDQTTKKMLSDWAREQGLDAIVSTDGDGDRPMVAGADGAVIAGDVLGPLTARLLGVDTVVTPVSSNSLVRQMDDFAACHITRIGSPYVIAQMEAVLEARPDARVAGYEANGGFLLGYDATGPAGPIAALMTRDSLLPIVAPLFAAKAAGLTPAALIKTLPQVFTASGRVQDVAVHLSARLIDTLTDDPAARCAFFDVEADEAGLDLTDGLRVSFADGTIVHLRPSGNAPECRCYVESSDAGRAGALLDVHLAKLAQQLGTGPS